MKSVTVLLSFEADCDGDGYFAFTGDCDDNAADLHTTPGEVPGLVWHGNGTIDWLPAPAGGNSQLYDVIRSSDPADFTTAAVCVATATSVTVAFETNVPASGNTDYYLVRASNSCGVGPLGSGPGGVVRTARSCP